MIGVLIILVTIWLLWKLVSLAANAEEPPARQVTPKKTEPRKKCHNCQHCSHNREKMQGRDFNYYCYCRHYGQIVQMRDVCDHVKLRGCNNGMCDHADFVRGKERDPSGKTCYCSYYGSYVSAKESCVGYTDEKAVRTLKMLAANLNK